MEGKALINKSILYALQKVPRDTPTRALLLKLAPSEYKDTDLGIDAKMVALVSMAAAEATSAHASSSASESAGLITLEDPDEDFVPEGWVPLEQSRPEAKEEDEFDIEPESVPETQPFMRSPELASSSSLNPSVDAGFGSFTLSPVTAPPRPTLADSSVQSIAPLNASSARAPTQPTMQSLRPLTDSPVQQVVQSPSRLPVQTVPTFSPPRAQTGLRPLTDSPVPPVVQSPSLLTMPPQQQQVSASSLSSDTVAFGQEDDLFAL